jgi:hypothetical protein
MNTANKAGAAVPPQGGSTTSNSLSSSSQEIENKGLMNSHLQTVVDCLYTMKRHRTLKPETHVAEHRGNCPPARTTCTTLEASQ